MKMGAICAGAMLGMSGLFGAAATQAAEIKVMASAAIHDAYVELIPAFERATENKVTTVGPDRRDDDTAQGRRDRRSRDHGV
jgi:ABC-type molybdate transport system substrate-binding protein